MDASWIFHHKMYYYFTSMTAGSERHTALIGALLRARKSGRYTKNACQAFSDWFILTRHSINVAEFYTLLDDPDFRKLSRDLYYDHFDDEHRLDRGNRISLRSSDGGVMDIDKSVATAESGVLKSLIDSIDERLVANADEVIPVDVVSSYVLSQIILFMEKQHHFQKYIDEQAGHYKAWSTAFINRNSHFLPDLHQAALNLQIPSLLECTSKELKNPCRNLNDNLLSEMFHYFSGMAVNNKRNRAILEELNTTKLFRGFDAATCEHFRKWFTQDGYRGKDHLKEFKTLMKSPQFGRLCVSLYWGEERLQELAQVPIRSFDGNVLKIDKRVAVAESMFLRQHVLCSGWWAEIPVSIASHVLSSTIDFCYKASDFHKIYGSPRIKEGLVVVDCFRGWVTEFLKSNIDMLSELYKAADFLEIPSLLLLTTEEVTDLVTRPLHKASVLSGKLSFSRMTSSLFVRVTG